MILRSPQLAALGWLDHGFGTRLAPPDWPDRHYVNLRQIHSDVVMRAGGEACSPSGVLGEGDGLVTNQPELWLGIRTADCAPVILADQAHRAAAVVHAGWRGTVNSILARTLERMKADFGTRPQDLVAAIGPTIGPCCFEVGEEVARQFIPWWPERTDLDSGRAMIDLAGTLRLQLTAAGLEPVNVAAIGECTRCQAGRYHSFRRDREASGRMVSAVRIRA